MYDFFRWFSALKLWHPITYNCHVIFISVPVQARDKCVSISYIWYSHPEKKFTINKNTILLYLLTRFWSKRFFAKHFFPLWPLEEIISKSFKCALGLEEAACELYQKCRRPQTDPTFSSVVKPWCMVYVLTTSQQGVSLLCSQKCFF